MTAPAVPATAPHPAATAPVVPGLPGWPALAVPSLFPLLWLGGLTVPVAAVMTAVMTALLVRARGVVVTWPVLSLLVLTFWSVVCGVMVDDVGRLLGWAFRLVILAHVAVTVLYVLNARTITRAHVLRALTTVWVTTVAGGWLGLLAPDLRLSTPVGMLLPQALTSNSYVRDLFMPPVAEVQRPWGALEEFVRPSAPFPYANSWGMAILLLTPVAVAWAMQSRRAVPRVIVAAGVVAMIPPAVATSNRMMFVGLGVALVYVVGRLSLRDRAAPALVAGLGVVTVLPLVVGGLLGQVSARATYGSASGRVDLYRETWERVLRSPVLGYGAPRPSETVPGLSVGTQGHVWTVLFSFGVVGLLLFLGFLWGALVQTWRVVDDVDVVLHATLVAASFAVVVYGLDVMQLLTVGLVAALLIRSRLATGPGADAPALASDAS